MEDDRINFNSRKQGGEPEDLETREITRQYIPMRDWDGTIEGIEYRAGAEVDQNGNDIAVTEIDAEGILFYDEDGDEHIFPAFALASRPCSTDDTWRVKIEKDICEQAAELPGTAWEVEYEGG